jgi:hypothetical protein
MGLKKGTKCNRCNLPIIKEWIRFNDFQSYRDALKIDIVICGSCRDDRSKGCGWTPIGGSRHMDYHYSCRACRYKESKSWEHQFKLKRMEEKAAEKSRCPSLVELCVRTISGDIHAVLWVATQMTDLPHSTWSLFEKYAPASCATEPSRGMMMEYMKEQGAAKCRTIGKYFEHYVPKRNKTWIHEEEVFKKHKTTE